MGGSTATGLGATGEVTVGVEASDFTGTGSAALFTAGAKGAVAGEIFFSRRLPVWLSVLTGSASAISSSIFFRGVVARPVAAGAAGAAGGSVPVVGVGRVGGRRTTPCIAGRVRVPVWGGPAFWGTGVTET